MPNLSKDSPSQNSLPCDPVPHAVFSVDEVLPKEKFEVWHDSISCIFDVDAKKDIRNEQFDASVDAHMFGPIMLARTQTQQQTWARSELNIAQDGMDHIMIQLYESGHTTTEHNNKQYQIPKHGIIIFDLAQVVTCKTNKFTNLSLIIPRQMLEPSLHDPDNQHMRTMEGNDPMVHLLRDHMLSLKNLANNISGSQAIDIAPATAALAATCLNASESATEGGSAGVSYAQLTVAKRYIESMLSSPELTPDKVALHANISRTRLYSLFAPHDGIANYIRNRRLNLALHRMISVNEAHRTLFELSSDCGFSSNSDFSRAFKRRYGLSPTDARQQGLAKLINPSAIQTNTDRRYESWLQNLTI